MNSPYGEEAAAPLKKPKHLENNRLMSDNHELNSLLFSAAAAAANKSAEQFLPRRAFIAERLYACT